jgi:hypothetical protein
MPEQILAYARLQLNIAMVTLEDAWLDGYESMQQDGDENRNPFPTGTLEHQHWADGWWASFYGEQPLFTLAGEIDQEIENLTLTKLEAVTKTQVKRLFMSPLQQSSDGFATSVPAPVRQLSYRI